MHHPPVQFPLLAILLVCASGLTRTEAQGPTNFNLLGSFAPPVSSIETMIADDFCQTIHVPEEQGPEGNPGVFVFDPEGMPFLQNTTNLYGDVIFAGLGWDMEPEAVSIMPDLNGPPGVDGIIYSISASSDLINFDRGIVELVPALDSNLPLLNNGWRYRSFRMSNSVAAQSSGFVRLSVAPEEP